MADDIGRSSVEAWNVAEVTSGQGSEPTSGIVVRGTLLDGLEELAVGLVAMTSRAIAETTIRGELTFQQWRILVVLGATDAGMRVSELGRRIAASGPSTSRLVNRLEVRGLVIVEPDPVDHRAVRIHLSAGGLDLRTRIVERRRALITETIGRTAAHHALSTELERVAARVSAAT